MRVSSWATPTWQTLFYIACGYYEGDKWEDVNWQKQTTQFFTLFLKDYLPCSLCRNSSSIFLKILELDKILKSKRKYELLYFLYNLKIMVDSKLIMQGEKEYKKVNSSIPTFKEIAHRYLSQSNAYNAKMVDSYLDLYT